MSRLIELSGKFEDRLDKTARRKKPKTSRKQVLKKIDKSKATYQTERKKLDVLKKRRDQLEAEINACQDTVRNSRLDMLKLKRVLSTMDLADCNYVMLYPDMSQDCGYLVDGEEYHIDVNDDGELSLKLMKEHKKEKRQSEKEDDSDSDSDDVNDVKDKPEDDDDEEEEDLHLTDDDALFLSNFRFVDE